MLTVDYDKLGLRAGDRVLDLGCGFGRHAFEALRRGANVVACDMSMGELRDVTATAAAMQDQGEADAAVEASVTCGDATALPFADASFDRVIASEVLEHVNDDFAAFSELSRVLRPGGVLAVTVPSFLSERVCWALNENYYAPRQPGGHVRIYTTDELRSRFDSVGLAPVAMHRAHGLHTPYWWLKCAVGLDNEDHPVVKRYHDVLVKDIVEGPRSTRVADRILNRVVPKSTVIYGQKPTGGSPSATGASHIPPGATHRVAGHP